MKKLLLLCLLAASSQSFAQNYQNSLNGKRLVLSGATCAGWEFAKNGKSAKWRNQIEYQVDDNLTSNWRVKWLDDDNLLMIETARTNEQSPPRVFAYRVMSVSGKKITLKDIWTGWNSFKDEFQTFNIK